MENNENRLTAAAKIYNEDNCDTNFLMVLAVLRNSETLVPLMETEYGVMPYILETKDGVQFYPLFSDENQIPAEYAESLSWAELPFEASAKYVMESVQVKHMLLNAFTSSVVIPEDAVRVLMNENAAEYAADGSALELSPAGEDEEAQSIKSRALDFFMGREDVKKAYFAKLKNGGEMSYIFVVDAEGDTQSMFAAFFEAVGRENISMPIDYTLYPSLKEQLDEMGCEPFFTV